MSPYRTELVPAAPGVRLAVDLFETDGRSGKAFLLVHGLASNARLYDGVAEELSRRGHLVAAVDLRGHGRSDKPEEGYDYDTLCADLLAVLDFLAPRGWPEAVVAVGQSFGANLVLELAARQPGRTAGVACIDGGTIDLQATFSSWEEAAEALRPPPLSGTPLAELEAHMRAAHPDWPESGIRGALANFEVRPDATVTPHLTLQRHLRILHTMWESRPSFLYGRLAVPVLFLPARSPGAPTAWGVAKEKATAEAVAAIERAAAHVIEGDHDLHAQHPLEVARLLDEAAGSLFAEPAGS